MRTIIAASACLVAIAGQANADEPGTANADQECPLAFRGAEVSAANLPQGVSLEFRNPNRALVEDMRTQLREVAELIEQHGTMTQTTGAAEEEVEFPPVDIAVKDTVQGARVTVRAARAEDIPALRELAFAFAEFWKTSACLAPLVATR